MAQYRNPHALSENDNLSPSDYLKRKLDFSIWDTQNPINHLPTCRDEAHHEVMIHGMCCIPHLRQCIEGHLFNLAGCKTGVFVRPEGYINWLKLADERLTELLAGQDDLDKWTKVLKNDEDLYSWIWNSDHIDSNLRPGFSLNSYVVACQKYGFNPDFKVVATAFGFTEQEVQDCWNSQ